jgi:arylsulfatase A-like enzyme
MTMLTGLFPAQHGVTRGRHALSPEVPLLAETLRAAGYRTIGLHHPVWVTPRHGFDRGFDVFRPHADAAEAGRHLEEELARLEPGRPYFLFLHLFDVHEGPIEAGTHSIYPPPEPFQEMFLPGAAARLPNVSWELDPSDPGEREALVALYDGGIRHVDAELERWFGELERRGLLDGALVIVTADHGENLLERGRLGGHGRFYEEGIRVPLLVRHPRGEGAGRRVRENVHLGDVVPTVLATVGLPLDPRLPGRSLFEALDPARVLCGEMDVHAYVLRGRRKIARLREDANLVLDLERDPDERRGRIVASAPEFDAWLAEAFDGRVAFPPPLELGPLPPDELEHLRALGYAGEVEDGPEDHGE